MRDFLSTDAEFSSIYNRLIAGELDTNDIHTAMAAHKLGIPSAQVTPEQRQDAKAANYLRLYSVNTHRIGEDKLIEEADYATIERRILAYQTGRTRS